MANDFINIFPPVKGNNEKLPISKKSFGKIIKIKRFHKNLPIEITGFSWFNPNEKTQWLDEPK